jgi:hypothetical protein
MLLKQKKFKFSEKDERFKPVEIKRVPLDRKRTGNLTRSKTVVHPNSQSMIDKNSIKIRSKSKQELDELYIHHCLNVNRKYDKIIHRNPKINYEKVRNVELKRCENCADFINSSLMLYCNLCSDAYHNYCLDNPINPFPKHRECIKCVKCVKEYPKEVEKSDKIKFRQPTVDEIYTPLATNKNKKVIFFNNKNLEM